MDLNIRFRVTSQAVAPVNEPVFSGIDGCLRNRFRPLPSERASECACALAGGALLRQVSVPRANHPTDDVGQSAHEFVHDEPPKRRTQRDDGSDAVRHSDRCGTGEYSTQAVSDEVHPTSGVPVCALDGRGKASREQIGTVRDGIHTGEVRTVADMGKPGMEFEQEKVHAQ